MPEELQKLKQKIINALADPKAPWYGSDVVYWVDEYIRLVEQEKYCKNCMWWKKDALLSTPWGRCSNVIAISRVFFDQRNEYTQSSFGCIFWEKRA